MINPLYVEFKIVHDHEKSGSGGEEDRIEKLAQYVKFMNDKGCKSALSKVDDEYVVVVCTPVMLRSHLLPETQIIMCLDVIDNNTGTTDCYSYIFSSYTNFGACVPLGCIITETPSLAAFHEGLQILIEDFELLISAPQYIMTNGDDGYEFILRECFPSSKFYICTYHLLKEAWNFILERPKLFSNKYFLALYYQFKQSIYSRNKDELYVIKTNLLSVAKKKDVLVFDYFVKLFKKSESWAHCFLPSIKFRGYLNSHPVEIGCRLFKDIPFRSVETYTQSKFVEFLFSYFDLFYTQKCNLAAKGNITLNDLKMPFPVVPITRKEETYRNIYTITRERKRFAVDTTIGLCTCLNGRFGRLCEHQSFVLPLSEIVSSINSLDEDSKSVFGHLVNYKIPTNDNAREPDKNNFSNGKENDSEDVTFCTENKEISEECISTTQKALLEVFDSLREKLLGDPKEMVPAIIKFRKNFQSCSHSKAKVVAGLNAAFEDKLVEELRQDQRRLKRKKLEEKIRIKIKFGEMNLKQNSNSNNDQNESLENYEGEETENPISNELIEILSDVDHATDTDSSLDETGNNTYEITSDEYATIPVVEHCFNVPDQTNNGNEFSEQISLSVDNSEIIHSSMKKQKSQAGEIRISRQIVNSNSVVEPSMSEKPMKLKKNYNIYCAYCRKNRMTDPDLHFYRFPKEVERAQKWLNASKLNRLLNRPPAEMWKHYRLCSRHFVDSDFSSSKKFRLLPKAYPSLFDSSDMLKDEVRKAKLEFDFSSLKQKLKGKLEQATSSERNISSM